MAERDVDPRREGGAGGELATRLAGGPCLLLDGGMGSMLLGRGLAPGEAPERLNLERPEAVHAVHAAYVAAGSEAVQTNTFGGNPPRLAHFGLEALCREVNRAAVALAREAGPRFVIGDIGPTGQYLPPVGTADPDGWRDAFRTQAAALLEAGVDAVHIETMGDRREALAALAAVRALDLRIPVLASLTFDRKRRGFFTVMGDPLVESLGTLLEAGAAVAGANCTLGSADMAALAAEALAQVPGRLVFQANAGQPRTEADRIRYDQDPADYAGDLEPAIRAGAAAIGGCCGTDPDFVAALAAVLARVRGGGG